MSNIKSFNDYIKKNSSVKEESDKGVILNKETEQQELSNDINSFEDIDITKLEKLKDKEFSIVGIQDVSLDDPREPKSFLDEAMIVNADLGGKEVKRGDVIWITALIKKNNFNINSMAVIKCRITDMYNSLTVLNGLK